MKRGTAAVKGRYVITPLRSGRRTVAVIAAGRAIIVGDGAARCIVDHREMLVPDAGRLDRHPAP